MHVLAGLELALTTLALEALLLGLLESPVTGQRQLLDRAAGGLDGRPRRRGEAVRLDLELALEGAVTEDLEAVPELEHDALLDEQLRRDDRADVVQ